MSLKAPNYETLEDAKARLSGSVVLYENRPVYISGVGKLVDASEAAKGDIYRVYCWSLPISKEKLANTPPEEAEFRRYISSRKFDMAGIKLGYMNYDDGDTTLHLSRVPVRGYKQGLCENNLRVERCSGGEGLRKVTRFTDIISSKGFPQMVEGSYPRLKDYKGKSSFALSRTVSVNKDENFDLYYVFYKMQKVGLVLPNTDEVHLAKKYSFLKETMEESHIPFNLQK